MGLQAEIQVLSLSNYAALRSSRRYWVQKFVGYLLIFLGIIFLILNVAAWLGIITPASGTTLLAQASAWDVLVALINKLPWLSIVGLLLIYAGMKMIGVRLPF
jgi:hypothetical protein